MNVSDTEIVRAVLIGLGRIVASDVEAPNLFANQIAL
jgi:hypothetical protein